MSKQVSELLQLCYNHPVLFAVFSTNKCPSDAVLCTTHLLAVPNVTGAGFRTHNAHCLTSAATLWITNHHLGEKATSQAHVHPGFNVPDRLVTGT